MKEPYSAGAAAVGLRLRQQRLKRGWSQEGLCRDICAASYLSKIEQGQVQAAPELLELLFRRLELPWYGESLPELERLVEHRYECLLDGDKEGFRDSREIFAHALDRLLSSPLAADGLVLDAMDRNDPTEIPPALEPYLDRRQLALLRIVQDREPEAVRRLMNVSPQNTAVAPNLTVEENLAFMAGLWGADTAGARRAAEDIMQRMELAPRRHDYARTLSGGWQRRLSIAMALITGPRVLFLDEPTLGLDVIARRELWQIINSVKKNVTIVLTTHYMEEAEKLSDKVAVMVKGEIKAVGTVSELLQRTGKQNLEEAFVSIVGVE